VWLTAHHPELGLLGCRAPVAERLLYNLLLAGAVDVDPQYLFEGGGFAVDAEDHFVERLQLLEGVLLEGGLLLQ